MSVKTGDSVRLLSAAKEVFGLGTVPAGTEGTVVLVYPDGACEADITSSPEAAEAGDSGQFIARPGQFEIIGER